MTRILETWTHTTTCDEVVVVPPDGCVDLILVRPKSAAPYWFLSQLQTECRAVSLKSDLHMQGIRLSPGTIVTESILSSALLAGALDRTKEYLEDACAWDESLDAAITLLSTADMTVAKTAVEMQMSIRSLQRLFFKNKLQTPGYWRSLARVRVAAGNMCSRTKLADHALQYGFADQANMTREFVRWFGVTPSQFQSNNELKRAIKQPGLAS